MPSELYCTVNHSPFNAHTESIFKQLNILPFDDLALCFDLHIIFHFKNNLPQSFKNVWKLNREVRAGNLEIELRGHDNFNIPFVRLQFTVNSPIHKLTKIWNNFPNNDVKLSRSKSALPYASFICNVYFYN